MLYGNTNSFYFGNLVLITGQIKSGLDVNIDTILFSVPDNLKPKVDNVFIGTTSRGNGQGDNKAFKFYMKSDGTARINDLQYIVPEYISFICIYFI